MSDERKSAILWGGEDSGECRSLWENLDFLMYIADAYTETLIDVQIELQHLQPSEQRDGERRFLEHPGVMTWSRLAGAVYGFTRCGASADDVIAELIDAINAFGSSLRHSASLAEPFLQRFIEAKSAVDRGNAEEVGDSGTIVRRAASQKCRRRAAR